MMHDRGEKRLTFFISENDITTDSDKEYLNDFNEIVEHDKNCSPLSSLVLFPEEEEERKQIWGLCRSENMATPRKKGKLLYRIRLYNVTHK